MRRIAVDGDRMALVSEGGIVRVWRAESDELLARLDLDAEEIAWRADGLLRILAARVEDRRIPASPTAHRVELPAGVGGLELSPDGTRAAVGTGDGSVVLVDLASARVIRSWRWQERVTKDVSWSPDGKRLAVATAGGSEQRILDVETGATTAALVGHTARRVAWLAEGLLVATYTDDLRWWPAPEAAPATMLAALQVAEIEHDGRGGVFLMDRASELFRAQPGAPPTLRSMGRHPAANCIAPIGDDLLLGTDTSVRRIDRNGATVSEVAVHSAVLDLAVSRDQRFVAVGHIDGTATVWHPDGQTPLASLEGHTARVASVAFSPDGSRIVTGAWDGSLRIWSTPELVTDPSVLARRIEAEWGRDLDAALGGAP